MAAVSRDGSKATGDAEPTHGEANAVRERLERWAHSIPPGKPLRLTLFGGQRILGYAKREVAVKRLVFASLRVRLVTLVLLAVLPALGLILHTASEQRRTAIKNVREDALRIARMASASQERLTDGAHQLLIALAYLPEIQGNDSAAANAVLRSLLPRYSLYSNFGVIEADGTVFTSAVPPPKALNLGDRPYFRRAMQSGDFAVGDYQIGRITGKASVNFGYPVFEAPGKVCRVVFVALDLTWLEQLAGNAELPRYATLTVLDSKGTILAGWPIPEESRGKTIANKDMFQLMRERHAETAEMSGPDGTPQLVAFVPLHEQADGGDVAVTLSIPKRMALKEADRQLARNLTWMTLALVLAAGAAWVGGNVFILRKVRAVLLATQRVRNGDLSTRTGLGRSTSELGQLAHAFDEMTESLEERRKERDRAEAELKELNEKLEQRVVERTQELHQKNEQLQADLELAREFQTGLLPRHASILLPGSEETQYALRLTHRFEPSGAVGGDFFEILPLSATEAGIFVCDVMGHGVRAALMAAIIRGLVQQLKTYAKDPSRFLQEVNSALVEILRGSEDAIFASASYVVIDIRNNVLRYASAGHSQPLHLHRAAGHVEPLQFAKSKTGQVLGLFPNAVYATAESPVEAGDGILIYTDGVFEVSGPHNEEFGETRLREAIQRRVDLPFEKIFTEVVGEIQQFSMHTTFDDDVCMVGVEVAPK